MRKSYAEYAEAALRLTKDIVGRHGARLSGTEASRSSAEELAGVLRGSCDRVELEDFDLRPSSFFSIGKALAIAYLAGAAAIVAGGTVPMSIGALAMLLGAAFCFSQFVLYRDAFDGLFPAVPGINVVASLEPEGRAERTVALVGHHDSAPVYSFYERAPLLYPLRLFLPILLFLFCLATLLASLAGAVAAGEAASAPAWARWAAALGLAFAAPMYGYFSKRGSPGAGDNLIGCAIGAQVAALFGPEGEALRRTRLVILFTDGEEAGQKGAKSYIARHSDELRAEGFSVVNVDSIYDYDRLAVVTRDRNGLTPLSRGLAESLAAAASGRGHRLERLSMPFGGGGTDAGQFARFGIEAVSLIGMPTDFLRKEIVFHTPRDTPDRIDPAAVAAALEILGEFIRGIDAGS